MHNLVNIREIANCPPIFIFTFFLLVIDSTNSIWYITILKARGNYFTKFRLRGYDKKSCETFTSSQR